MMQTLKHISGRANVRGRAMFLCSMLENPRRVGAVWPTSGQAVRDLLDMADLRAARMAVELGVGTGVYTQGMLDRLPPQARLLAFEVDPRLAASAAERIGDPRLRVVNASAEDIEAHLRGEKADVIVSSLPLTTLPKGARDDILDAARRALVPGGSLLVLQYSTRVLPDLERRFLCVRRRFSPLNVPPAFLFACRKPGDGP